MPRPGRARREVQRDVVARAGELGRDRAADGRELGARDAGDVDAPRGRLGARGAPDRAGLRAASSTSAARSRAVPASSARRPSVPERARQVRRRAAVAPSRRGRRPARGVPARRATRLAQPAGGRRGHDDPVAAAAAAGVPDAARERAQLGGERRRGALARGRSGARARPRCQPARASPRMRASAPGAAVVDARRRDVADPPAGGAQPALPLLLVARPRERRVERADAVERRAADGEVRAPDELGVAVRGAEVERRHRRRLAPARVQVRRPRAARGSARRTPRARGARRPRRAARRATPARPRRRRRGSTAARRAAAATAALRATLSPRGAPSAT